MQQFPILFSKNLQTALTKCQGYLHRLVIVSAQSKRFSELRLRTRQLYHIYCFCFAHVVYGRILLKKIIIKRNK